MPFKEEVKIALSNRKIDKLNEWRSRYSKHEYPYKVVLNMFYELYSISFIWDEISSYFSGNKRYSDFKQAYHYVADLKSEVQVQKVNPQLIQLLNSNVKAGPESFSVWEEDIEKAKTENKTAIFFGFPDFPTTHTPVSPFIFSPLIFITLSASIIVSSNNLM